VENMSYFVCPDCGKRHEIFGPSHVDELAKAVETKLSLRLPIDPKLTDLADNGKIEEYHSSGLQEILDLINKAK